MKTRTRRRTPFLQSRLAFILLLWLIIAVSSYGFAVYATEASRLIDRFGADYAHPVDYYAEGCLTIAIIAGITMFLARVPSTPPRFKRTSSGQGWFDARPDELERRHTFAPKPRRRS